uniref:Cadherin domain-containing protein n=1 Tax=Meloidogyne hapla TaxID=6305 RepID=A0A1I8BNH9_MELHA
MFNHKIKIYLFLLNIYLNFGLDEDKNHLCLLENEQNSIYLSIPENTEKDTVLTVLPIVGIPFGDKQNIKLNIINGQQYVLLNNKQLKLKQTIDRDIGLTNINILIECIPLYFNESLINQLNIKIFISIIDVNDNSPKFIKNGKFEINLHEELPIGTKINLDFKAVDIDQPGPNSHIRYKIVENSTLLKIKPNEIKAWDGDNLNETILYKISGENSRYFIIDEFTGIIQIKTNNELPLNAQLIVNAYQLNRPERNSTAFVLFENNYQNDKEEDQLFNISSIHIISFICFLLILTNCLIFSLWLGEKKNNKMFVFFF